MVKRRDRAKKTERLWLALRFPFLQLQVLDVDVDTEWAMVVGKRNTISAATLKCSVSGVELGMPASTAQLMANCQQHKRDRQKEAALLDALCERLYAYTPYIQKYCPDETREHSDQGLLLELSRCTHLFKGEAALFKLINDAVSKPFNELPSARAPVYCFAHAHSARAAWVLAGVVEASTASSLTLSYDASDVEFNRLLALPITSLDEYPDDAETLQQMGFKTLKDLHKHIQCEGIFSLQKRFSENFIHYLFDILPTDNLADASVSQDLFRPSLSEPPPTLYQTTLQYSDVADFEYPVTAIELLHEPIQVLLKNLSDYLVASQMQCSGVRWVFADIYQNEDELVVRCDRIYRDWHLLYELTLIQLEQRGLPFEVDQLTLNQPVLINVNLESNELAMGAGFKACANNKDLQRVSAKIQARLGESNMFKVSFQDDHFPELSSKKVAVNDAVDTELKGEHCHAPRPSWMLNTPVAIGKNQNNLRWHGRMQLIRGPERLEGHWWHKPTARDYFVAVRDDQVRLWIFNDLMKNEWFVQGVF